MTTTLHYTTLHYTTLHYTTPPLHYTATTLTLHYHTTTTTTLPTTTTTTTTTITTTTNLPYSSILLSVPYPTKHLSPIVPFHDLFPVPRCPVKVLLQSIWCCVAVLILCYSCHVPYLFLSCYSHNTALVQSHLPPVYVPFCSVPPSAQSRSRSCPVPILSGVLPILSYVLTTFPPRYHLFCLFCSFMINFLSINILISKSCSHNPRQNMWITSNSVLNWITFTSNVLAMRLLLPYIPICSSHNSIRRYCVPNTWYSFKYPCNFSSKICFRSRFYSPPLSPHQSYTFAL